MLIKKFRNIKNLFGNHKETLTHPSHLESGMVTAEYALGTVATTGIAGVLIWISQQEWFRDLLANLFKQLISSFL